MEHHEEGLWFRDYERGYNSKLPNRVRLEMISKFYFLFPTPPQNLFCIVEKPCEYIDGAWCDHSDEIVRTSKNPADASTTLSAHDIFSCCTSILDYLGTQSIIATWFLDGNPIDLGTEVIRGTPIVTRVTHDNLKKKRVLTLKFSKGKDLISLHPVPQPLNFVIQDFYSAHVIDFCLYLHPNEHYVLWTVNVHNENMIKELKWFVNTKRIKEGPAYKCKRAAYVHLPWGNLKAARAEFLEEDYMTYALTRSCAAPKTVMLDLELEMITKEDETYRYKKPVEFAIYDFKNVQKNDVLVLLEGCARKEGASDIVDTMTIDYDAVLAGYMPIDNISRLEID
ncbi:oxidoreductase-like motif protein [Ranid herpesvirus 3]|uniref:Oxidoreductase-like motif protein n=1 Tax=Ranid herpesvirus 3 TaxID=1987509 RepID=A0A1X9T573_9VIRU|nr:oxidoreductase-like motif protein [Ranid herpesvirus 3]ARR28850.1 oxidoreductase-like motif protein [Ranid herpesvirus 3]